MLTKHLVHLDTSVMGGELSEPMLISSQSSSANGPPPRKIILGRNLKNTHSLIRFTILVRCTTLHKPFYWNVVCPPSLVDTLCPDATSELLFDGCRAFFGEHKHRIHVLVFRCGV